jgi:uncharacterized protein
VSRVLAPQVPALVVGTVSHTRRRPLHHTFTHRQFQWLVDVDELPALRWPTRWLARFEASDHLDGARRDGGLRADLESFLARHGVWLDRGDRVLMLAHARVLGHVFDPLTVFWCLSPDDELRAVVFEVHNTYGERHAYLLDVDAAGRAHTDKTFYVSPFNDVAGTYDVRLLLTPKRVTVTVGLDRDGDRVLTATSTGTPVRATYRSLVLTTAQHLLMTQRVSLLIRWHGLRLWLRRLPVLPRPTRHSQESLR